MPRPQIHSLIWEGLMPCPWGHLGHNREKAGGTRQIRRIAHRTHARASFATTQNQGKWCGTLGPRLHFLSFFLCMFCLSCFLFIFLTPIVGCFYFPFVSVGLNNPMCVSFDGSVFSLLISLCIVYASVYFSRIVVQLARLSHVVHFLMFVFVLFLLVVHYS